MSLKGKVALVLGASGVVGSGAVFNFLKEGATVVVVSRTEEKLKELIATFGADKDRVIGITGSYASKKSVEEMYAKIKAALKGGSPDHVVSSIGFAEITPTGILSSDGNILAKSFDESLYPTIFAAQVILADIKNKDETTFTHVSGGLAHICAFPGAWAATIKNAAVNSLLLCLASDTADAKVRVNCNCLHFSVAKPGDKVNQMGMPAQLDSHQFGRTFLGFIHKKDLKGKLVCFGTPEDAVKFF